MSGIAGHPCNAPHGTRARYVATKCRCPLCREANSQYYRARQKAIADRRDEVKPSGPPITSTLLRRGRPCKVTRCPGANGKPCVRTPASWLRGQGDVCATCVERATVWNGNVPIDEARAHLLALRGEGVGYKSVADACDVGHSALARVLAGQGTIRAATLKKILDVDAGARADHAIAPPTGVERMNHLLEQLHGMGFRKHELARLLGSNSQALQIGRTGRALVTSVGAVERLWKRVERGEVKPAAAVLVDAAPVYAVVAELLEEGWISHADLERRLKFKVNLKRRFHRMPKAKAERVTKLAADLARERSEASEKAEREHDLHRFGSARTPTDW